MNKITINDTPIRTSRNFRINNITIDAPEIPDEIKEFENVEIKALSTIYDENVDNIELTYGIGEEQEKEINAKSNQIAKFNIEKEDNIKIIYTFDDNNKYLINNLEFKVNKNANIIVEYRSNTDLECYHNGKIRVIAGNNVKANVTIINFLNKQSTNFDSIENEIKDNATLNYTVVDIGGKYSITNYYSNILGKEAKNDIKTIYLGTDNQIKDINYIAELRGQKTNMEMDLQGALKDNSKKNFKGTIDFKKGSKKAKGHENEACMMLSEKAKSLALPMLLCTEEDVEGEHSTSSGKADEKELFYIMSRGLSKNEAIKLMVKAKFYDIIERIQEENLKTEVIEEIDRRLD